MKKLIGFCALIFVVIGLLTIAGFVFAFKQWQSGAFQLPTFDSEDSVVEVDHPQIGISGILLDGSAAWMKPDVIFTDFENLHVNAVTDFGSADLTWGLVEPQKNQWDFSRTDPVFEQDSVAVIATLFGSGRISSAAPWEDGTPQAHLTEEAKAYLLAVIDRYGSNIQYWRLGEGMDAWRSVSEDGTVVWDFSPEEQGAFLAEAAMFIREHDADAVILMPTMSTLDSVNLDEWLPGVVKAGKWFDIVDYQYGGGWKAFGGRHDVLRAVLAINELQDLPVWLTGLQGDSGGDEMTRAGDLATLIVQAFGYGDEFVAWHGYTDSIDANGQPVAGLRTKDGEMYASLATLGFITKELTPFVSVEQESHALSGTNAYRFTLANGEEKMVVWGDGSFVVPDGFQQAFVMVPSSGVMFEQHAVTPGSEIQLSSVPVMLK